VLDDLPPAFLALVRLAGGAAVLVPTALLLEGRTASPSRTDRRRIVWMGVVGFAGAFALGNWGLARSTATNAALLIIAEPVSIMLLGPLVLGEHLTRRETAGAALAVLGAVMVVLNGIPGAYTLIGRGVLARHSPLMVTARSIVWGALVMVPLVVVEWQGGARPALSAGAVAGGVYLAVVITALGYLLWNWALVRVGAPQAAIFITVQPIGGALLGVLVLHEPLTAFTVAGGLLVVAGLWLTVTGRG
jgi:drug/metabolite transporter (DMT)-like permease